MKKSKFDRISITIPKEILKKIDDARGMIPRSTFIVDKMKRTRWKK